MIYLKTPEEIEKMQAACTLVSRTLGEVAKCVAPGVTTRHLDNIAREFMRDMAVSQPVSVTEVSPAHCVSKSMTLWSTDSPQATSCVRAISSA